MRNPAQKISDPNEGLLRRVWLTPKNKFGVVDDQITGRQRAPAAAFRPRFKDPANPAKLYDEALSINVESSVLGAGLPRTWGADPKKHYIARVTLSDCSEADLEADRDPLPGTTNTAENPHHGLIWGLVEMREIDPNAYERAVDALAKASTIVLEDQPITLP